MPTYIAPVQDMMFLFEKLRNNKNYNEIEKYKEVTPELVRDILEEGKHYTKSKMGLNYGEMKDITAIPSFPVKSPQNGIVFVHVILSFIGMNAKVRILTIVVINYLLYLSGVFPLYKIARWSGLERGLPLAALLSVYLGPWHIYRINLLAINDGIFNSLILWLAYMLIRFIHDMDILKSFSLNNYTLFNLFLLIITFLSSALFVNKFGLKNNLDLLTLDSDLMSFLKII